MVRIAEDKMISGIHLIVYRTAEGYLLRDNNSTNGTKLNGKLLLAGKHLLRDGDRITIGKTELEYREALPEGGLAPEKEAGGLWSRLTGWFRPKSH